MGEGEASKVKTSKESKYGSIDDGEESVAAA